MEIPRILGLPEELSLMLIGETIILILWIIYAIIKPKIFRPERELFKEYEAFKIPMKEVLFACFLDLTSLMLLVSATYSFFLSTLTFLLAFQPFNILFLVLSGALVLVAIIFIFIAIRRGRLIAFRERTGKGDI